MDGIFLKTWELTGTLLDLLEEMVDGGLWEDSTVIFHVFLGVLIGFDEHEFESSKVDSCSQHKISLGVVFCSDWVCLLLSLHETATDSSGVLIADLIYLDGVVTAVEGNDEFSCFIIWLGTDQLGLESKDMHVLLEHFLHVNLWWLGIKRVY